MNQQSTKINSIRRGHNEGSFKQTKKGSWRSWVTLRSGKRISKTLPTKTEAREWFRLMQTKQEPEAQNELTFGEYIVEWFLLHSSQIKDSTKDDYNKLIQKYIVPNLGNIPLVELHRSVFDKFYKSLEERDNPVGDYQINYIHRVIHKSLKDAMQDHLLDSNPSDGAKTPRILSRKKIHSPLSEVQACELAEFSMQYSIGPLVYFALLTGMREGELFALKWSDLNWFDRKVHVQRNLVIADINGHQEQLMDIPKSSAGNREFPIGMKALEVLQAQKKEVAITKVIYKDKWQENNLVFPSRFGTPRFQSNLRRQFLTIQNSARINPLIRFHDLRHIAASIMLNNGIPLLTVSYILGHAQPSTTLNMYGHPFEASALEAAQVIDNVFSRKALVHNQVF